MLPLLSVGRGGANWERELEEELKDLDVDGDIAVDVEGSLDDPPIELGTFHIKPVNAYVPSYNNPPYQPRFMEDASTHPFEVSYCGPRTVIFSVLSAIIFWPALCGFCCFNKCDTAIVKMRGGRVVYAFGEREGVVFKDNGCC